MSEELYEELKFINNCKNIQNLEEEKIRQYTPAVWPAITNIVTYIYISVETQQSSYNILFINKLFHAFMQSSV